VVYSLGSYYHSTPFKGDTIKSIPMVVFKAKRLQWCLPMHVKQMRKKVSFLKGSTGLCIDGHENISNSFWNQ
jgi:hypothetical protein